MEHSEEGRMAFYRASQRLSVFLIKAEILA